MKKNVASQTIGAQMCSATDGSAFTGAVTIYVTGDAGTQAVGSVGAGACTHEGNGYHTYAPAQAETNYNLIAFTFIGTGAIPATVQVYTSFPQTVDNAADITAIKTKTDFLPSATAGAAGGVFIAGTNASATITGTLTVSDGIVVTRSSANSDAVRFIGAGTGSALRLDAGTSGHGMLAHGGGGSGDGIRASAFGGGGSGISSNGNGTGSGIAATSGSGATGNGITALSAATNGNGISTTGTGTGNGIYGKGGNGTNGDGLHCEGGTGASAGIRGIGGGTSGSGLYCTSIAANGSGFEAAGNGSGDGMLLTGGATGDGLHCIGGATSGHGIIATGGTLGNGAVFTGVGAAQHGVTASGGASGISNGINAQGNGTGHGVNATSGAGLTGNGINAVSGSSNGNGIQGTGTGTGDGLSVNGGTTGRGIHAQGGSASGAGARIEAIADNSDGIHGLGFGTGDGLNVQGGATGNGATFIGGATSGHGIEATVTSGNEIDADLTGAITGSLSGSVGSVTGAVGSVTGAVGSVTGLTAATVHSDLDDIQARLPAALVGGRMDANTSALNNVPTAAARIALSTQGIVFATVGAASTTTSVVTSAMDPAAAVTDQFKGRIVTFNQATTTANLRGQSTDITASTALGVLTVTALTTAPVSGDTFVIT